MRTTCFAAVLLFASTCLAAPAQTADHSTPASADTVDLPPPAHPATADQIREYLNLTHAVDKMHKVISQNVKTARITSAPYFTGGFWDDMEKAVLNLDLVTPIISSYQKYYSQEDMAALIAFYKSSAGQRMLAAEPHISADLDATLRQAGAEACREVGEKHKDEIQRLIRQQQQQQHPSTPPVIPARYA